MKGTEMTWVKVVVIVLCVLCMSNYPRNCTASPIPDQQPTVEQAASQTTKEAEKHEQQETIPEAVREAVYKGMRLDNQKVLTKFRETEIVYWVDSPVSNRESYESTRKTVERELERTGLKPTDFYHSSSTYPPKDGMSYPPLLRIEVTFASSVFDSGKVKLTDIRCDAYLVEQCVLPRNGTEIRAKTWTYVRRPGESIMLTTNKEVEQQIELTVKQFVEDYLATNKK